MTNFLLKQGRSPGKAAGSLLKGQQKSTRRRLLSLVFFPVTGASHLLVEKAVLQASQSLAAAAFPLPAEKNF
jgi:hypothetical protein